MLKACLNGGRGRPDHPAVPLTAAELAADAARCAALGVAGPATWPVLAEAVRRGLDARIGLEDTLHLPDGSPAADNAALVAAAVAAGAS